jgi:hypothetical protein
MLSFSLSVMSQWFSIVETMFQEKCLFVRLFKIRFESYTRAKSNSAYLKAMLALQFNATWHLFQGKLAP